MLIRFLGTSAGELYPGIWCRCRNCNAARTGPPEDRRQSAALFVMPNGSRPDSLGAVLIDFPSEIAVQAERHHVDLPSLEHLLVSHSHGDHWFPYLLRWRHGAHGDGEPGGVATTMVGGPRLTSLPTLHIWGNSAVEAVMHRDAGTDCAGYAAEFHAVCPMMEFTTGEFIVTTLPANHDVGREDAVHYVLRHGAATVLYGLDGDTFLAETREALTAFRFDLVIMESTYGHGDGRNHRNFARLIEEADWFRSAGLMTETGRIVATHFSPHHCPPHRETAEFLRQDNIEAAFDGMEILL